MDNLRVALLNYMQSLITSVKFFDMNNTEIQTQTPTVGIDITGFFYYVRFGGLTEGENYYIRMYDANNNLLLEDTITAFGSCNEYRIYL